VPYLPSAEEVKGNNSSSQPCPNIYRCVFVFPLKSTFRWCLGSLREPVCQLPANWTGSRKARLTQSTGLTHQSHAPAHCIQSRHALASTPVKTNLRLKRSKILLTWVIYYSSIKMSRARKRKPCSFKDFYRLCHSNKPCFYVVTGKAMKNNHR